MILFDLTGDLRYYGYILPSGFILFWIFQVSPSWRDRRMAAAGLNRKLKINLLMIWLWTLQVRFTHNLFSFQILSSHSNVATLFSIGKTYEVRESKPISNNNCFLSQKVFLCRAETYMWCVYQNLMQKPEKRYFWRVEYMLGKTRELLNQSIEKPTIAKIAVLYIFVSWTTN